MQLLPSNFVAASIYMYNVYTNSDSNLAWDISVHDKKHVYQTIKYIQFNTCFSYVLKINDISPYNWMMNIRVKTFCQTQLNESFFKHLNGPE